MKLPSTLEVVREPPRTGQITLKPYTQLALVDSTRIDVQGRLTRRQIGPVVPLGAPRGRFVKTIGVEIQYRSDKTPRLVFRLDAWECKKDAIRGGSHRLWYRRAYIKLSVKVISSLVGQFGGTGGPVAAHIQEGMIALKEARIAYHVRVLAAKAEVQAMKARELAGVPKARVAPTEISYELDDLVGFG